MYLGKRGKLHVKIDVIKCTKTTKAPLTIPVNLFKEIVDQKKKKKNLSKTLVKTQIQSNNKV